MNFKLMMALSSAFISLNSFAIPNMTFSGTGQVQNSQDNSNVPYQIQMHFENNNTLKEKFVIGTDRKELNITVEPNFDSDFVIYKEGIKIGKGNCSYANKIARDEGDFTCYYLLDASEKNEIGEIFYNYKNNSLIKIGSKLSSKWIAETWWEHLFIKK